MGHDIGRVVGKTPRDELVNRNLNTAHEGRSERKAAEKLHGTSAAEFRRKVKCGGGGGGGESSIQV